MLKEEMGLPSRAHNMKFSLCFVSLPCEFRTPISSVVIERRGSLNEGQDWCLLRSSDYAVISAESIDVSSGTILWHIENGTTIFGGYEKIPASFPWKSLLGGAVLGYSTRALTENNDKVRKE